jgi:hypothetical protein
MRSQFVALRKKVFSRKNAGLVLGKGRKQWSIMMLTIGCVPFTVPARADVTNGAFTDGNSGFSTAYTFAATDPPNVGGHYTVDSDPLHFNTGAASFGDHTTGKGPMLIIDGSTSAGAQVWNEPIAVIPHVQYTFSYYSASWGNDGSGRDPSPATLFATANGLQVGSTLQLLATDGVWSHFSGTFDSGSQSTILVGIQDLNTTFLGNDFAIDDISVLPTPEPGTPMLALCGIICFLLGRPIMAEKSRTGSVTPQC